MSNLLVTGRWGQTHVTSAQARNFHAGVFGSGQYVLSGLTATMTTANTCHIDPGVACFNGADVEVPAGGEDVTIDNGTQGMMRHDLVVLRYSSEPSTQTESVELVVVKGTPAASNPQDPAHNGGSILEGDSPCDMPLYRIPLNGITVGDPVLLAPAWMAPNRAVVSSADGTPTASAVTATELGYLSGAESSVQGQLDALGDSLSHYVRTTQFVTNATLNKSSTSGNFWLLFDGLGADSGSFQVAVDVETKTVTFTRDRAVLFVLQGA